LHALSVGFYAECAVAYPPRPRLAPCRRIDDAARRAITDEQADHHRELAVLANELTRAVDRVHEAGAGCLAEVREALFIAFFGNDGHARELRSESGADELVGSAIGLCDRIAWSLVVDLEVAGVDLIDELCGLPGDFDQTLEQRPGHG